MDNAVKLSHHGFKLAMPCVKDTFSNVACNRAIPHKTFHGSMDKYQKLLAKLKGIIGHPDCRDDMRCPGVTKALHLPEVVKGIKKLTVA